MTFAYKEEAATSAMFAGKCLQQMYQNKVAQIQDCSSSTSVYGNKYEAYNRWTNIAQAIDHTNLEPLYIVETSSNSAKNYPVSAISSFFFSPFEKEDNWALALEALYGSLERSYTKSMVERLRFLAEPSDDPEDPILSFGSLKQFIGFVKAHNLSKPDLVLSSDGNIRAEWRTDKSHHFVAEFQPDGFVKFLAFVQSTVNTHKIERSSGIASIEKLVSFMQTTGAKWCFE